MENPTDEGATPKGQRLLFFSGTECTHCHEMEPLVLEMEKETGVTVTKLEIWHNSENNALYRQYEQDNCGGIPFFYNEKNAKWICGNAKMDKLKEWALSE